MLKERQNKAKEENLKIQEMAFLVTLEKETKRNFFDEKLRKTHERKKLILRRIQDKQKEQGLVQKEVISRKDL